VIFIEDTFETFPERKIDEGMFKNANNPNSADPE